MKYPYGISDFREIITDEYFYCDRTDKIPILEDSKSQLFIRPRRFGKSLLLSMLENYYDIARKDEFEKKFKNRKKPDKTKKFLFYIEMGFFMYWFNRRFESNKTIIIQSY